jgi:hypothetical protein
MRLRAFTFPAAARRMPWEHTARFYRSGNTIRAAQKAYAAVGSAICQPPTTTDDLNQWQLESLQELNDTLPLNHHTKMMRCIIIIIIYLEPTPK